MYCFKKTLNENVFHNMNLLLIINQDLCLKICLLVVNQVINIFYIYVYQSFVLNLKINRTYSHTDPTAFRAKRYGSAGHGRVPR